MNRLIIFLIFGTICSCLGPDFGRIKRAYSIVNDTEYVVVINFESVNEIFSTSVILLPGEQIPFETNDTTDEDIANNANSTFPASAFGASESATVIYDNERQLVFSFTEDAIANAAFSEPIQFNILRNGNYENIGDGRRLYTITQADFEAATPCDGPCE